MNTAALWDAIEGLSGIRARSTSSLFPPRIKRKDSSGSRLFNVRIGNPRDGPGYAQIILLGSAIERSGITQTTSPAYFPLPISNQVLKAISGAMSVRVKGIAMMSLVHQQEWPKYWRTKLKNPKQTDITRGGPSSRASSRATI